jgi:hypothetical protein
MSSTPNHTLEPKYGWGHEQFKEDLAQKVEALYVDSSWRPQEVIKVIAKMIRES